MIAESCQYERSSAASALIYGGACANDMTCSSMSPPRPARFGWCRGSFCDESRVQGPSKQPESCRLHPKHRQLESWWPTVALEKVGPREGDSCNVCWPPVADGVVSVEPESTISRTVEGHTPWAHDTIQRCVGSRLSWCEACLSVRHTALQTHIGKMVERSSDISQMLFIRAMAIRQILSSVPAVKMRTTIGIETMQENRDRCS